MAESAAAQEHTATQEQERKPEESGQTSLTLVDGKAPPLPLTAQPLSLTALHSALTASGVEMPYSSLSQFVALGDIAEQLGVGGKGNRREFPRWSVDFLVSFVPWYQSSKINKELAPDALRHRLVQFRSSDEFRSSENSITRLEAGVSTQISTSQNSKTSTDATLYESGQPADIAGPVARFLGSLLSPLTRLPAAMDNVADAIRELRDSRTPQATPQLTPQVIPVLAAAPLPDRLLGAEEAAALLSCSPRSVNRRVVPFERNPNKYRQSDVFRYLQDGKPMSKTGE